MTYQQLKLSLKKLKISVTNFAILIDQNPNGLNRWNKSGVPTFVINFLELLEQLPLEQRAGYIARKLEESEKK
jgi:hypothetical protein